jgi:ABC-type branched-subunit amino acid transport system substrate-binding protein
VKKGRQIILNLLATIALAGGYPSRAEVGILPRSILLGQSAAFSGPSGELGREFRKGAHEYIQQVNAHGGIYGREIVVIYRDDQYEPARTLANTKQLVEQEGVFALFGYVGTPTFQAALPIIEANKVPVIATVSGAQALRKPNKNSVFNIRASYHDELSTIVQYLKHYGKKEIALIYQNDSFGKDGKLGLEKALKREGLRPPIVSLPIQRKAPLHVIQKVAQSTADAKPDAVITISAYNNVANVVEALRQKKSDAQIFTISFVGSQALARQLGKNGHGVGISQVVPFPWDARMPLVKEYQNLITKNRSNTQYGFSSLEGFLAAKVLVEALKDSGPEPTRKKFVAALERMQGKSFGGYRISFSPENHNGSKYVELTFITGGKGAFIH